MSLFSETEPYVLCRWYPWLIFTICYVIFWTYVLWGIYSLPAFLFKPKCPHLDRLCAILTTCGRPPFSNFDDGDDDLQCKPCIRPPPFILVCQSPSYRRRRCNAFQDILSSLISHNHFAPGTIRSFYSFDGHLASSWFCSQLVLKYGVHANCQCNAAVDHKSSDGAWRGLPTTDG